MMRELLECGNGPIVDMATKCEAVFATHDRAIVSVSGGADSDVMVDLCERVRRSAPIEIAYVWFDTGLEYDATKRQLDLLESKYGIVIGRERAVKTIPVCVREYGQPFVSKYVSQVIEVLQRSGFEWDDMTPTELARKYPNAPIGALRWWSSSYEDGRFNISRNAYLREYMQENPPTFPISAKCCTYAKKMVGDRMVRRGYDLSLIGVRRVEGGIRAIGDRCLEPRRGHDTYKPLFWLSTADRNAYCEMFGVTHSDCYEVWGFQRTGCVGCPFAPDAEGQLMMSENYEPNVATAARRIFGDAYEYTGEYRRRRAEMMEEDAERYEAARESRRRKLMRPIVALDRDGNVVARYESQLEAEEVTGVAQSSISRCIHGRRPTAGGYVWKFDEKGA